MKREELLVLVNKQVPFFSKVNTKAFEGVLCREECGRAYTLMKTAALKRGLRLKLISGYRSYEYQRDLFTREVKRLQAEGLSLSAAQEKANESVALPGYSEHHTGLALDIMGEGDDDVGVWFEKTEEFLWLCKNAADFGFILRYPKGKERVTGYTYEPWHYRFVGDEAVKIKASGKVLEEWIKDEKLTDDN